MTHRGRVLRDTNAGPGLLTAGGKQFSFTLEDMWQSELPPRPGMIVDVTFDIQGAPQAVRLVPDSQIAKEQTEQAIAGARKQGGAIAGDIQNHLGMPGLVAQILLLLSFFLLPNASVGSAYSSHSLTGWETVGLNMSTGLPTDHGLLSLLAIPCLFGPFAVPFWRSTSSRWLNAAPLGFSFVALATIRYEAQKVSHAAVQSLGQLLGAEAARQMSHELSGALAPAFGAYLVLICALYLATRSLKSNYSSTDPSKRISSPLLIFFLLLFTSTGLSAQAGSPDTPVQPSLKPQPGSSSRQTGKASPVNKPGRPRNNPGKGNSTSAGPSRNNGNKSKEKDKTSESSDSRSSNPGWSKIDQPPSIYSDDIDAYVTDIASKSGPSQFVTWSDLCVQSLRAGKPCAYQQQQIIGSFLGAFLGASGGMVGDDPVHDMQRGAQEGQRIGRALGAANAYPMQSSALATAVLSYDTKHQNQLQSLIKLLNDCVNSGEEMSACLGQKAIEAQLQQIRSYNFSACARITGTTTAVGAPLLDPAFCNSTDGPH